MVIRSKKPPAAAASSASPYVTIHLHNISKGREADFATWFDGPHREALKRLRGFNGTDRFEVTAEQIMPDIRQPWRYISVYEFTLRDPAIDVPSLGPLIADARDAGLIAVDDTERLYTYRMYSDWRFSPNWQSEQPFSGINIILANYVAGGEAEYQRYYDDIHTGEVINIPGNVGLKRGELSSIQIEPRRHCPGDQLILGGQQTDDLSMTLRDFSARFRGASPSGIAMAPRCTAASFARTVHYFRKISGTRFWPGGIAYAGDLSVYSGTLPPST
jgi:hypothetical protein